MCSAYLLKTALLLHYVAHTYTHSMCINMGYYNCFFIKNYVFTCKYTIVFLTDKFFFVSLPYCCCTCSLLFVSMLALKTFTYFLCLPFCNDVYIHVYVYLLFDICVPKSNTLSRIKNLNYKLVALCYGVLISFGEVFRVED